MTTKMKPEIKKLWVDALRSGEYKQGREALSVGGAFCCLGVLCDLAVKAGVTTCTIEDETGRLLYSSDLDADTLPLVVQEWAGLRNSDPEVQVTICEGSDLEDTTYKQLSELNDSLRFNFQQIADKIEKQL